MYEANPMKVREMSLKAYRKMKVKMLQRDFHITLTEEELEHVKQLKNEIQIDQFCISKFMNAY